MSIDYNPIKTISEIYFYHISESNEGSKWYFDIPCEFYDFVEETYPKDHNDMLDVEKYLKIHLVGSFRMQWILPRKDIEINIERVRHIFSTWKRKGYPGKYKDLKPTLSIH
jgi:hypothetical protein